MSVNLDISPFQEKKTIFHSSQLAQIDLQKMPRHIAIIPDGNRRWAKKRLSNVDEGHREGADTLMEITKAAKELGVKELTFYCFSTENWSRPPQEVLALMLLFASYLTEQEEEMIQSGIRLETIGNEERLPLFLRQVIASVKKSTEKGDKVSLILALNYGSRDEISRAFKGMLEDYDRHLLKKEDINESTISRYLDTHQWGDPDLLIRTSGEMRISNFLLWQVSYCEIHQSPVLWPDFTPQHLLDAVIDFQCRERRWGGA